MKFKSGNKSSKYPGCTLYLYISVLGSFPVLTVMNNATVNVHVLHSCAINIQAFYVDICVQFPMKLGYM